MVFPNVEDAIEKLISITIKNHQSKEIVVWGVGHFRTNRKDVHYVKCDNEQHLNKTVSYVLGKKSTRYYYRLEYRVF